MLAFAIAVKGRGSLVMNLDLALAYSPPTCTQRHMLTSASRWEGAGAAGAHHAELIEEANAPEPRPEGGLERLKRLPPRVRPAVPGSLERLARLGAYADGTHHKRTVSQQLPQARDQVDRRPARSIWQQTVGERACPCARGRALLHHKGLTCTWDPRCPPARCSASLFCPLPPGRSGGCRCEWACSGSAAVGEQRGQEIAAAAAAAVVGGARRWLGSPCLGEVEHVEGVEGSDACCQPRLSQELELGQRRQCDGGSTRQGT